MGNWMNHAWFRRETLSDLKAMTWREIRMVGRWAVSLYEAEEKHARELEKAQKSG